MIAALDLATSTGWAFGRGDRLPSVGALRLPSTGHDAGEFGAAFWRWLDPWLRARLADLAEGERLVVILESPILPGPKFDKAAGRMVGGTNIETTRKLQGLAMLVELACHFLGEAEGCEGFPVDCREVALNTVKKELTGDGHADKGAMILAARRAGLELSPGFEGADEADAFGIWLVGVRFYAPEHLPRWDRLLWTLGRSRD